MADEGLEAAVRAGDVAGLRDALALASLDPDAQAFDLDAEMDEWVGDDAWEMDQERRVDEGGEQTLRSTSMPTSASAQWLQMTAPLIAPGLHHAGVTSSLMNT